MTGQYDACVDIVVHSVRLDMQQSRQGNVLYAVS